VPWRERKRLPEEVERAILTHYSMEDGEVVVDDGGYCYVVLGYVGKLVGGDVLLDRRGFATHRFPLGMD
jgi:hypothetical protein